MEAIYDISFFDGELDLIQDSAIRDLTREALEKAPAYTWYIPASITGKHHPPDDNTPGGSCWHRRKTAWVAYRMFDNLMLNTDIAVSAGLLHDIAQRGLNDIPEDGYESYQKHGELAADRLCELSQLLMGDRDTATTWYQISECVKSHMGRWGNTKPKSIEQVTFHLADVAASTKGLVSIYYPYWPEKDDIDIYALTVPELVGRRDYFKDVGGELVFAFGKKHMDILLSHVAKTDDGYLRWMLKQGVQSMDNKDGFPKYVLDRVRVAQKDELERRRHDNQSVFESGGPVKGRLL